MNIWECKICGEESSLTTAEHVQICKYGPNSICGMPECDEDVYSKKVCQMHFGALFRLGFI